MEPRSNISRATSLPTAFPQKPFGHPPGEYWSDVYGDEGGGGLERSSSNVSSISECGPADVDMDTLMKMLQTGNSSQRRDAAAGIRGALKNSPENKSRFITAGGVPAMVDLLRSPDPMAVEHAVTALLNVSLVEGAPAHIAAAGGVKALAEVLKSGTSAAKGNAAAVIFSLSGGEEQKALVRSAGAIPPLVSLLSSGNLRGKKDAALALFNLSRNIRCSHDIVKCGGVPALVALLTEPGLNIEDKSLAVLANLVKLPVGQMAFSESKDGLPAVMKVLMQSPSVRAKEDALVVLMHMASNNDEDQERIRRDGGKELIAALQSQATTGIARTEKYAKSLLELLGG